jgi:hypothetical protein
MQDHSRVLPVKRPYRKQYASIVTHTVYFLHIRLNEIREHGSFTFNLRVNVLPVQQPYAERNKENN